MRKGRWDGGGSFHKLPCGSCPTSHVPRPTFIPHPTSKRTAEEEPLSSGAAGRESTSRQEFHSVYHLAAIARPSESTTVPPRLSAGAEKCTEHPPSSPITPPREVDFQSDPDGRSRGLTAGKGRQQRRCNYWTPFVPTLQTLHAATEYVTSSLAAPRGQVPIPRGQVPTRGPGIQNATTAWSTSLEDSGWFPP